MMWLLLTALAGAPAQDLQHACGQLTDTPAPSLDFGTPSSTPLMKRRHPLLQLFSRGDGELTRIDAVTPPLHENTALYPLPWEITRERRDHMRLLAWQDRERVHDENMLAMVLRDGESWCSSELTWDRGARLRFEALSIEKDRQASLELTGALPYPGTLRSDRQADVPLSGASGVVCFRVTGGAAAIGEARIVEPDNGSDSRPRWMVLTVVDSLRGDLVRGPNAETILPTVSGLGADGQVYDRAVSPGCHTRASVWPIMMDAI